MATIQEGQTATNPKTGQKVVFKGGQWVNAGGGGAVGSGMGVKGPEAKELVDARTANMDGKDTFHSLANIYRTAAKYPGGIPNNVADQWRANFGNQDQQVQDQQLFKAQAGQAALGQAKLLAPVSNTDFQNLLTFGPNPGLRFDNNKQLIGAAYEKSARHYFENAFKQRFAAKHGSLEATDSKGQTYPQALATAMSRPDVAQELLAPWKRNGGKGVGSVPNVPANTGWKVIR